MTQSAMPSPVKYQVPHHKDKPFGGAGPVEDPVVKAFIKENFVLDLDNADTPEIFIQDYRVWIQSSCYNSWQGLDEFNYAVQTQGTTEAFDKFYLRNHQRRFRCFRGEYMYHQLTWRYAWPDQWKFIEDADLDANDAVVLSYPFADTGGKHSQHDWLLDECDRLGIPVLLDSAYFGVCYKLSFDVRHPCITDIAFSLSKTFPVAHARIGMRLTRIDDDDPGFVLQKSGYINRIAAQLGLMLIREYTPDFVCNRYRLTQKMFCEQLGVAESHSVLFGIGDVSWQHYNRGTDTNRLSFHRYLDKGILPNDSGHNI